MLNVKHPPVVSQEQEEIRKMAAEEVEGNVSKEVFSSYSTLTHSVFSSARPHPADIVEAASLAVSAVSAVLTQVQVAFACRHVVPSIFALQECRILQLLCDATSVECRPNSMIASSLLINFQSMASLRKRTHVCPCDKSLFPFCLPGSF